MTALPRPRSAWLLTLAAVAALTGGLLAGPLAPLASASVSGDYEINVKRYTNVERDERDLKVVKRSACLDKYAERQARKMAEVERMYHQDLGPILADCELSQVGENVAYGYPDGKAAVDAWMHSPPHKQNLLNSRHRLIGVGAYQDQDGTWYVSQVLGRRA